MALTGVVVIGGIITIINDLVGNPALTDLSETYLSVLSRRLRKVPFHKLKIPLVVFQVLYSDDGDALTLLIARFAEVY